MTCFTRKTSSYFRFAPPPYPRDKTVSNNSPHPGPKGWTCPGGCPRGMVTALRVCLYFKLSYCTERRPSPFFHITSTSVIHYPSTRLSTRTNPLESSSPITSLGHRHTKLWWAGSKELMLPVLKRVFPLLVLSDPVER